MAHFIIWKQIPKQSTFSLKKTGTVDTESSGVITAPDKKKHVSFDDAQLRAGFACNLNQTGTWVCVASTDFLAAAVSNTTFDAQVPNRNDTQTLSGSSTGLKTDAVVYAITVV
jgi:hypothetical protein